MSGPIPQDELAVNWLRFSARVRRAFWPAFRDAEKKSGLTAEELGRLIWRSEGRVREMMAGRIKMRMMIDALYALGYSLEVRPSPHEPRDPRKPSGLVARPEP